METTHAGAAGSDSERFSLRILLVEDHEDTSRVMTRLLERLGYGVRTAANIADALQAASSGGFDLVISDIGLPDGSGLDLMRKLRQTSAVPGIALTGFGMDVDVANSKEAGFVEHLTKPIDFQKLEALIRQVAGRPN